VLYGQIRHVPEEYIITVHDEPPSRLQRLVLTIRQHIAGGYRITREGAFRLPKRLPLLLPILFSLLVCLAQGQYVHAYLKEKHAPLSSLDSQKVSLVLANYLNLDTLTRAYDGSQFSQIALKGEVLGGANSTQPQEDEQYVVQTGDTVSTIANSHDLHSVTLSAANNLTDGNALQVGQVLHIPREDLPEDQLADAYAKQAEVEATARKQAAASISTRAYASVPTTSISFVYPTGSSTRSRGFGGGHTGIDFTASMWTPIHAAADGCVALVAPFGGWGGGYGNYIVMQNTANVVTLYGHMVAYLDGISVGDCFTQGQIIGYVGSTGNSTGPHVHFEMRINGVQVDPSPYF